MMDARTKLAMTIAGGLWAVAGCGSAPPPTHAQTDATAAVRAATELGAAETPVAAYQLELANGELRSAETLIHDGHLPQAQEVLERAKADAELAMALRREAQSRTSATASRAHIAELRDGQAITSGGSAPETHTTTTVTTTTAPPHP